MPLLISLASLWCFKDKERVWTSAQGVQIRQLKRNYCWISAALVLWALHLSTRTGTRAAPAARAELWSLQSPAMNCVGKDAVIQLKQLDFGPLHIQIRDDGKDVHASLKFLRWTLHLERKCNMCWQRWKYQVCPSSWSSIYSIIQKWYKVIGTGKEEISKNKMYLYVSNSGVQFLMRKLAV